MKCHLFIVLLSLILFSPATIFAVRINGNLEYLFSYLNKKDTLLNPDNILFLDDYSNLAELRLNIPSADKTTMNIDIRGRYDFNNRSGSVILDQAYLNFGAGDILKFKFGRQRIGFGVGYLWNPVNDLDIRKDVYNPLKYTEGIDGLKFIFDFTSALGKPMNINFEILPPEHLTDDLDLSYSKIGTQFYLLTQGVELGLAASYKKNTSAGKKENILYGMYSSVDVKGIILGIEYARAKETGKTYFSDRGTYNKTGYYPQLVINANRRITEKSFLVLEYFYNGPGYDNSQFNNLVELCRSSYTAYGTMIIDVLTPGYVSKNYFFGTLSFELTDNLALALSGMFNLDRGGCFIYPELSWTKIENFTLSLEGITNITSNKESEFSLSPYNYTVLVRSRYFF